MPDTIAAADSPAQSALRFKREELKRKLSALDSQPESPEYETDAAKERARKALAEVESQLGNDAPRTPATSKR